MTRRTIQYAVLVLLLGCGARTDLEDAPVASDVIRDGGPEATADAPAPSDVAFDGLVDVGTPEDVEVAEDVAPPDDAAPPEDAGDGGVGTCPASTSSFTPMKYTPAVAHQGVCTSADVGAFVTACGDDGTAASCNAWVEANVPADGGAGTP